MGNVGHAFYPLTPAGSMARNGNSLQALNALSVTDGTRAYSRLRAEVIQAGILDRSYFYYLFLIPFAFGGFAASAVAIYLIDSYLLLIPACLAFTFFSLQLAGVN